jgi:nucleolar protein 56
MKVYIAEHAIGAFAFDENGKLLDCVNNPQDIGKLVEILINAEKGEPMPSTIELLKKMNVKDIIIENEAELKSLQELGFNVTVQADHIGARLLRENIVKYAVESKFVKNEKEYYEFLYQLSLEYTRRKIRGAAQKRDLLAIQAIRAIDDIDKTINLFSERLREWYSLHFPELDKLVDDHEIYSKIVSEIGSRENINPDTLKDLGLQDQKVKKILEAAKKSIGADITDLDLKAIRYLSTTIVNLYEIRRSLTDYLEVVMREVAPNITALVGPTLGARLLSLAGSLEELAKMPASTIQVLGAEKALFRALRTGGKPPKHGVIFQYPAIHTSPRWQRGKIARALAAKLAIAARVDAFSGRFIGDQLREQMKKRIEEIKTKYANPPPRKPIQQQQKTKVEKQKEKKSSKKGGK